MVFERRESGEVSHSSREENLVVDVVIIVSGDEIQAERLKGDKVVVKPWGLLLVSYIWLMCKLESKAQQLSDMDTPSGMFPSHHTFLSFAELVMRERTPSNWRHMRRASRLALGNAD